MLETVVLERFLVRDRQIPTGDPGGKRQRIYILPSRQGIIFSFLLLTMLLGAINYNNSMAYLLTFLLGSLFLVGIIHTYRNLSGLVINSHHPEPIFAGETAHFPFSIDNRNGHHHIAVELSCLPKRSLWRRWKDGPLPASRVNVAAGRLEQVTVSLPAVRRGRLPIERVCIATQYPLGLCRAWSAIETGQTCLVYPAPAGNALLPPARPATEQEGEGDKSGTEDFTGFRHYRPGDSIRNIAWKKLAHDDQLLVKRFSGAGGNQLVLTWEDTDQLDSAEARWSQLCLWVLRAEASGYRYGLQVPGTLLDPDCGFDHRQRCLETLALAGNNQE